jgi:hypothetical protein
MRVSFNYDFPEPVTTSASASCVTTLSSGDSGDGRHVRGQCFMKQGVFSAARTFAFVGQL